MPVTIITSPKCKVIKEIEKPSRVFKALSLPLAPPAKYGESAAAASASSFKASALSSIHGAEKAGVASPGMMSIEESRLLYELGLGVGK